MPIRISLGCRARTIRSLSFQLNIAFLLQSSQPYHRLNRFKRAFFGLTGKSWRSIPHTTNPRVKACKMPRTGEQASEQTSAAGSCGPRSLHGPIYRLRQRHFIPNESFSSCFLHVRPKTSIFVITNIKQAIAYEEITQAVSRILRESFRAVNTLKAPAHTYKKR